MATKHAPTKLDKLAYLLDSVRKTAPKTLDLKAFENRLVSQILAIGETSGNYYQVTTNNGIRVSLVSGMEA